MKVKILEDHETPTHKFTAGTEIELEDGLAQSLIDQGKAEGGATSEEKPKAKPKRPRAKKETESADD